MLRGGEPPFIGAIGAQEVRPSPPRLGSPWTRSMIVETIVGGPTIEHKYPLLELKASTWPKHLLVTESMQDQEHIDR